MITNLLVSVFLALAAAPAPSPTASGPCVAIGNSIFALFAARKSRAWESGRAQESKATAADLIARHNATTGSAFGRIHTVRGPVK